MGRQCGPRFIPAGAGNSVSTALVASMHSVYPRWRGELQLQRSTKLVECGLSPLARGTH
ncbi:hypothetical protein SEH50133_19849, partial [Salmonella enterica subsp. houtenae serovar 50:g,z51:- str. 01-0133]